MKKITNLLSLTIMKKIYSHLIIIVVACAICLLNYGCTQSQTNEDVLTTSKIETFNIIIPIQDTRWKMNPNIERHKNNLNLLISVNTETEKINDIELSQESLELCPMTEEEFDIFWHRELEYIEIEATPTDEYSEIRVEFYGKWQECKAIEERRERINCKIRELSAYLSACLMGYLGW